MFPSCQELEADSSLGKLKLRGYEFQDIRQRCKRGKVEKDTPGNKEIKSWFGRKVHSGVCYRKIQTKPINAFIKYDGFKYAPSPPSSCGTASQTSGKQEVRM